MVGSVYRQCFTNYCLDYGSSGVESQRVRPAALGKDYLVKSIPVQPTIDIPVLSIDTVILNISVKRAAIPITDNQEFDLKVLRQQDQSPISNITATVKLTLPDNTQVSYSMPATNSQGDTLVIVDPIYAANGTIIPFTVCLDLSTNPPICGKDSFVIWTNP